MRISSKIQTKNTRQTFSLSGEPYDISSRDVYNINGYFFLKQAGQFSFHITPHYHEHGADFMADWLKIPSKQKRREEDIPEPYEIVCVCGVSLSVIDEKSPIVMPASSVMKHTSFYPTETVIPLLKREKRKSSYQHSSRYQKYILNSSLVTRFLEKRALKKASLENRGKTQPQTVATPKVSPFELPPPRTRLITPFRGILAGIALIIGLTAYGIIHSRKIGSGHQSTLKAAILSGEALLKKNDLVGADAAYQEAFSGTRDIGTR